MENVSFIKFAEKRDRAKRKGYPSFLAVASILFKLVSVDAELNSALENERYFCQIIGCGTWKSSQT